MAVRDIAVVPAGAAEKPVIANLVQLYLYDMTGDLPFPVGPDGLYAYDYLDRFWQYPRLIMADGEIAGFALVIDHCPITNTTPCFFMAEFFVLKAYRQSGVGRTAFDGIVAAHPGKWHVAHPLQNTGAGAFWAKCMRGRDDVVSSDPVFDGENWHLYEFRS